MASASLLNCNCEPGPPGPPGPRGPPGAGFGYGGGGGGGSAGGGGGYGAGGYGGGWGYPVPPFNPHLGPLIGPRGLPGPPGPPGYCFPCPYGGGPGGFGNNQQQLGFDNGFGNGNGQGGPLGQGGALGQGIASAIGNIIIIPSGANGRATLLRITPDGQVVRIENPQESINGILPSAVQDLLTQQAAAAAVPTAASLGTGITPPNSQPVPTVSTTDDQTDGLDETAFAVAAGTPERKDSPLRASSDANDWRRVLLLGEPNESSAAASASDQSNTTPLENSMDSFQRALVDLRDKYASLMQPRTPDQRYAVIL